VYRKNEKVLRPVHPNVGIEMEYRRRLLLAIGQMHTAVLGRVSSDYQREPPPIAQDDRVESFLHMLRQQFGRWMARFDAMAQELAAYFAQTTAQRSDAVLRSILKKGGMSVEWHPTPAQQEILHSTIAQNVALIRSIPARYLDQVEQAVLRSVQTGRDLKQLQGDIQRQFGVAKYRAALIARDQSNKATAALTRVRQVEVGVTEAVWLHSGGGKHPRPSHVKAGRDRVRYDVRKGWFDPHEHEWVLPGQLINCRCVSRSVIKGFS